MKPYFETKNGVLYHGDCLDILPCLKQADLIITSPPYDDLRKYDGYKFDFHKTANLLKQKMLPGSVIVWVVGDETIDGGESGTSFRQALYFKDIGFKIHDTMIYQKNGPAYPSKNRYYSVFEYMFIFKISGPRVFNPIKDRKNRWYGQNWSKKRSRRDKNGVLRNSERNCDESDKYGVRFNVWKYSVGHGYSSKDKIAFEHPAIFPEKLAEDHILSWSNKNETVMDPFIGSGTTAIACERLNRKWIGIEISEKYCEIAAKRIEKETQQLKLPGM